MTTFLIACNSTINKTETTKILKFEKYNPDFDLSYHDLTESGFSRHSIDVINLYDTIENNYYYFQFDSVYPIYRKVEVTLANHDYKSFIDLEVKNNYLQEIIPYLSPNKKFYVKNTLNGCYFQCMIDSVDNVFSIEFDYPYYTDMKSGRRHFTSNFLIQ